jgi:hypothetical protein
LFTVVSDVPMKLATSAMLWPRRRASDLIQPQLPKAGLLLGFRPSFPPSDFPALARLLPPIVL